MPPLTPPLIASQLDALGLSRYWSALEQFLDRYIGLDMHVADLSHLPLPSTSTFLDNLLMHGSASLSQLMQCIAAQNFNYWHIMLNGETWNPLTQSLQEFDPLNDAISLELEQPLMSVSELTAWFEGIAAKAQ